jgi:plasmid stabilization system protein ParE
VPLPHRTDRPVGPVSAIPLPLTEEATADLEEAIAYIGEDSPRAALRVVDTLEDAFRFLAEWPSLGHRRQDLTHAPDLRFWTSGRDLIAYLPTENPILIIAVLHSARDAKSLMAHRFELL